MKITPLWLCFILCAMMSCQSDELLIPTGKTIQLNSIMGAEEWTNSRQYTINDSLRLRMHHDDEYIYIAADFDRLNLDQYRWVELYIFDTEKMYRFHASGQLGEQFFQLPFWTENWDWGNNEMWTATTQRLSGADRKSSSNQAYEFKFEKRKFKSRELRILFHGYTISTQADFNAEPFKYYLPSNADRFETDNWLEVHY